MSLSNIDTSPTFTAAFDCYAGGIPLSVGGENPDGPEWQALVQLSFWEVTSATVKTISVYAKGRNGRYTSIPSYLQVPVTLAATPTAVGHYRVVVTPVGNAVCRLRFVFYT